MSLKGQLQEEGKKLQQQSQRRGLFGPRVGAGCRNVVLFLAVAATLGARCGRCAEGQAGVAPARSGLGAWSGAAATSRTAGYLGIDVRDVGEDQVSALRLKDARGAVIVRVDHDGPAGKMGLRERDVVVQMNGIVIEGEEQIRRLLRETAPGRSVMLVVSRDGQQLTLSAQLADREQVERQAWVDHLGGGPQAPVFGLPMAEDESGSGSSGGAPAAGGRYGRSFLGTLLMSPSYTGAMLEKLGPQLAGFFGVQNGAGLLVRSVETNSPAALAGMRAGDVVLRANAHAVDGLSTWAKLIKEAKGRPVTVVVFRDRVEKTLTLTPDGKRRSSLERAREGAVAACLPESWQGLALLWSNR